LIPVGLLRGTNPRYANPRRRIAKAAVEVVLVEF